MPAISSFGFSGFLLKPASKTSANLKLAADWIAADPDHRDTTPPEFWFDYRLGVESYLLEDKFGPVFFYKMNRTKAREVEIHIQFPPASDPDTRARVMRGLTLGLEWIERVLAQREQTTLFFRTKNPALHRFAIKRLGFAASQQERHRLEKQIVERAAGKSAGRES